MFGNATLRGGQTLAHDVHMWGPAGQVGALRHRPDRRPWSRPSPCSARPPPMNGDSWGTGTLAQAKLALGYQRHSLQTYEWREGKTTLLRIVDIANDPRIERIRRRFLHTIYSKAWLGLWIGAGGMVLCAVLFSVRGRRLDRARRVRGAEMATARELRRRVRPPLPPSGRGFVSLRETRLVPDRRDPLAQTRRDPAHHGLGHHRIRERPS